MNPLKQISDFVSSHKGVAVVFDLDSTLFCVSPRTQAILRQLGGEPAFATSNQELASLLRGIEVLPTDWGIRCALERSKAPGTLELFKEVRNYWRKHFFANHFLEHDVIYPAANQYVRRLHELGAEILYLTGRNEGSMRPGTIKMLKHWGFPYDVESHLYMKPSDVQTDESYKVNILKELVGKYDHLCFFENEPVIIHQVQAELPQVKIVFVNSVHSGRADAPTGLPTIGMSYNEGV